MENEPTRKGSHSGFLCGSVRFCAGDRFFLRLRGAPLAFALKPVTDPEHRHKPQARAQFAPQMVDMDIHRAGAQPAGHAPHLGQQLPAGQSPPGLEDEGRKQRAFGGGKRDRHAMLPAEGLTPAQTELVRTIILELQSPHPGAARTLTPRQMDILNGLLFEFTRRG